jgi:outer membrane protein TolC
VYRSRVVQAELAEKAATQRLSVAQRRVRLEWKRARAGLRALYLEVDARAHTIEIARDSYLQAESLYRGGVGSALEVLDAYDAWSAGSQAHAETVLRYRLAQAELLRLGTP